MLKPFSLSKHIEPLFSKRNGYVAIEQSLRIVLNHNWEAYNVHCLKTALNLNLHSYLYVLCAGIFL